MALVLISAQSCGTAPASSYSDEQFELAGTLKVEGRQPFDRDFFLLDRKGIRWNIDPGDLEAELVLLSGYEVLLTCGGAGRLSGGIDARVESYILIPPDGMTALLGTLKIAEGSVYMVTVDKEYMLTGPLSAALTAFESNRSWVWGSASGGNIELSGYEIIGN